MRRSPGLWRLVLIAGTAMGARAGYICIRGGMNERIEFGASGAEAYAKALGRNALRVGC
jgi:NADH:ubiquinone oxidoreductase subunit F (NADH-binding)